MLERTKIVEVKKLVKNYGNFCAVKNISFDVYQCDVFGFLGQNGAGKSTTIRTILSLIKPTSGSIKLFDKDLNQYRNTILSKIGCIVEKPDFYKFLSAEKNLELFARISGVDVNKSKLHELIEFVGLKGREKERISGFSHGMKQRLGIAQTLIHNPDLIVLDEPTTGLDPQGIIDVRNLILKLKNEQNKTVQGSVTELLNAQDLIVSFTVNDVELSKRLLSESSFSKDIDSFSASTILFHTAQENIAHINKLFCDNHVLVSAIETKRKLEDYFLKLIAA
jgi:ABC-type multidrug transport system ATPase subunit